MYFAKGKKPRSAAVERRTERRYSFRTPDVFLVEFRKSKSKDFVLGFGMDITRDGVRFTSPYPFKKKDQLEVVIYFSRAFHGKRKLHLSAHVMRVEKPDMNPYYRLGCKLEHVSSATQGAIKQFLDWVQSTPDLAFVEV